MREIPQELHAMLYVGERKGGGRVDLSYLGEDGHEHFRPHIPETGGGRPTTHTYTAYKGTSEHFWAKHTFEATHPKKGAAHIIYHHTLEDGTPGHEDGLVLDLPEGYHFDIGSNKRLVHADPGVKTERFYPR